MRELDDTNKQQGQGFQFPGTFEITAMGGANSNLRERVPELLRGIGLSVLDASVRQRTSSQGNYESVSITFNCPTREKYEEAHAALRAHPDIRYTL